MKVAGMPRFLKMAGGSTHRIDGKGESFLSDKLVDFGSLFIWNTNKGNAIVFYLFVKTLSAWYFSNTRRRPGGPEIEEDHLPFYINHFEILTVKRLNSPIMISRSGGRERGDLQLAFQGFSWNRGLFPRQDISFQRPPTPRKKFLLKIFNGFSFKASVLMSVYTSW